MQMIVKKTPNHKKVNNTMIKILPAEISTLSDDDIIVVNRVRLNSRLVRLEIEGNDNLESIIIIHRAIENMMIQQKTSKKILLGAKMAVGDIKKVFPDFARMPSNSFVRIE